MQNFYFLAFDSAFYWVRSSTLESDPAKSAGLSAEKVYTSYQIKDQSALCFNRFNISRYYRILATLAKELNIPIVFDIDDLFWNLPEFSSDFAKEGQTYLSKVEEIISKASIITTTQEFLKEQISLRYPNKQVFIVPNARPNWTAPKGGVLIANTDSFKLDTQDLSWFKEIFQKLITAGIPVQLIGKNEAISNQFGLDCYVDGEMSYQDYLNKIKSPNFKFGLILVSDSEYANCKSNIKALEFLSSGMEVFASNIYPYRTLKEREPELATFNLIENNQSAWNEVLGKILNHYEKQTELCQATLTDSKYRQEQLASWQAVSSYLKNNHPKTSAKNYLIITIFNFTYLIVITKIVRIIKKIIKPFLLIKKLISK